MYMGATGTEVGNQTTPAQTLTAEEISVVHQEIIPQVVNDKHKALIKEYENIVAANGGTNFSEDMNKTIASLQKQDLGTPIVANNPDTPAEQIGAPKNAETNVVPLKTTATPAATEKAPAESAEPPVPFAAQQEVKLGQTTKEDPDLDSMVKAEEEKVLQKKEKALGGLVELLEKDVNPSSVKLGSGDKKALILIKPSQQGYIVVTNKEVFTFPVSDDIQALINKRYLDDKVAAGGNSDAIEGISEGKLGITSPNKELKTFAVTPLTTPEPLIKTVTESRELAEKIDAKMKTAERNKVFTQKINEYVQARKAAAPALTT
jgi:hypothetical protein